MAFEDELLSLAPKLRAYARQLLRDRHDADDLVQDVILRNRFSNKDTPGKRGVVSIDAAAPAAHAWREAGEDQGGGKDDWRKTRTPRATAACGAGSPVSNTESGETP